MLAVTASSEASGISKEEEADRSDNAQTIQTASRPKIVYGLVREGNKAALLVALKQLVEGGQHGCEIGVSSGRHVGAGKQPAAQPLISRTCRLGSMAFFACEGAKNSAMLSTATVR